MERGNWREGEWGAPVVCVYVCVCACVRACVCVVRNYSMGGETCAMQCTMEALLTDL